MARGKSFFIIKFALIFLLQFFILLSQSSLANITVTGDVDPAYDSSDPWTILDDLLVGDEDDGSVSILGGSDVQVGDNTVLALTAGVLGTMNVTNAGSQLDVGEELSVGGWGEGTMTVSDGATVTSENGVIGGYDPMFGTLAEYFDPNVDLGGGTGTVTVTGEGSNWQSDGIMAGFSGDGTLEITDGGQVVDYLGAVGLVPDSVGTVEVSGPNSVWTNNLGLVVGAWGEGDLTIEGGAQVSADEVFIGGAAFELLEMSYDANYIPDGTGTVTVTGDGSQLYATGASSLYVGYFGTGTLDINDGGQVTSEFGVLGGGPDAVGTVTVEDAGSTWVSSGIIVGAWGEGNLNISGGGQVTTEELQIGGFDVNDVELDPNMVADFGDVEGVGTVTVTGDGSTLTVTGEDTLNVGMVGTGTLMVSDGADVNSVESFIGGDITFEDSNETEIATIHEGGTGTATVTGNGSTWVNETLVVGAGGEGTLNVSAKGAVTNNLGIVGLGPNSVGTASVTGQDSTWTMVDANDPFDSELDGTLIVGAWGEGTLTVSNGGEVNTVDLYIGGTDLDKLGTETEWGLGDPDGTGTVTVTGDGSTLNVTGEDCLYVGYFGDGTLDVNDGGLLASLCAVVGVMPDSNGLVTVNGEGSTWRIQYDGEANDIPNAEGNGDVVVSNGGQVLVDGSGAILNVGDSVTVGSEGEGTMTVSDEARVTSGSGVIGGYNPVYETLAEYFDPNAELGGGTGTVTVTGEGSIWQSETLMVGFSGDGTLGITGGGLVTDYTGMIGVVPDGVGTVEVSGPNSVWGNNSGLAVGVWGEGDLTIEGGALVRAGDVFIGGVSFDFLEMPYDANYIPDGTGTVTVTGDGSLLDVDMALSLYVGYFGTGTLDINDGGQVTSESAVLGGAPDAVGTVTVEGAGSSWDSLDITVGAWGEGNLNISGGGQVTAARELLIGGFDVNDVELDPNMVADFGDVEGTGTVNVTGEGSQLSAWELVVGGWGEGTMTVSDGATVTSQYGIIDNGIPIYEYFDPNAGLGGGTGTVTVTGEGSNWQSELLMVGYSGNGTLEVTEGGQVTDSIGVVGVLSDGVGTVEVSGPNSVWTNNSGLMVGAWGEGDLVIEGGAQVTAEEVYIGGVSFELLEMSYDANYIPEGTGTVTVTGDGSTLDVTGDDSLYVGYFGTGTLDINDGGQVTSEFGVLGGSPDAVGTVTVEDANSAWVSTEGIIVGAWGEGNLNISGGGQVTAEDLFIGGFDVNGVELDPNMLADFGDAEGTGTVNVTGEDSQLTVDGLVVGGWGEGTMTVSDGATVTSVYGIIDFFDPREFLNDCFDPNVGLGGGTGTVTVTGDGSNWETAVLMAGFSGSGTLEITEGGQVTDYIGMVGVTPDGVGTVEVSGPDSVWTNNIGVVVGGWGEGSLEISGGGQVTAGDLLIGGFDVNDLGLDPNMVAEFGDPEGTGAVTVTGEGSELEVSGVRSIYVGYTGTGTLDILNGGQVSSDYGYIAFNEGSVGTVNVIGDGSSLEIAENLYVGIGEDSSPGGTGLLVVEDGGLVNVGDTLTIGPTGTLQGDGTIQAGTLSNSGTIAPGGSIGTMTVDGDVVFEPNSIFEVEIDNTSSDKMVVTGDVDIQGGTVKAVAEGTIVGSHEYQIIEANGVTGTFDVLDTALVYSVTDASLGYDDTSVWLYIIAMAFDDPNVCQTKNQKALGQGLQQIAGEGGNDITDALQELESFGAIRGAYDQLCGQLRPTLGPITTMITSNFIGTMSGGLNRNMMVARSNRLGGKALWAMAGPDSMMGAGIATDVSAYGQFIALGNGTNILGDKPWGVWVRSYGLFGDRDSEDGVNGYRYTTYGFGIGTDYQFTENLRMGITSGFSNGRADYYNSEDESEMEGLHVGLYGRWVSGSWYASALFAYTDMQYDTDRYVDFTGEHLIGEPDGYDLAGYLEAGLSWLDIQGWQINPMVAVQLSSLSLDDYSERGGPSALRFDSERYESFKSSLGARVKKVLSEGQDGVEAVWEVRGRWVHEFEDVQSTVDAAFVTNPDVVFKVSDSELPRDSAVLGTGLNARLSEHTAISVEYDVRLNEDDIAHLLGLVLQYRW